MWLSPGSTVGVLISLAVMLTGAGSHHHAAEAFQPIAHSSVAVRAPLSTIEDPRKDGVLVRQTHLFDISRRGLSLSLTQVIMAKKPTTESKYKEKTTGVVKQEWDASLFLTYMTPWKNPNSIFVYLFLTLYLLGEYSEAHRTPPPGL
ncbi:hypothetical protein ACA910_005388 [Epithemia clementina (nom. ined.)]